MTKKAGSSRTDKLAPRKSARKAPPAGYEAVRKLALSLGLPGVTEGVSRGQPCLKAHGKLWAWSSPHEDALVFKVPVEEREMLIEAEPKTFFVTPHYRDYDLVLVRPGKVDLGWARANLIRVWREMAPKRLLKDYDAGA